MTGTVIATTWTDGRVWFPASFRNRRGRGADIDDGYFMHIADFSVKNSFLVNLLMAAVILMGLLFSFSIPLELFPSVKLDVVTVETVFPGSSAEDVEQLVSIPLEQRIKNISGVDTVKSVSSEGLSKVTAELNPGEDVVRVAREIDSKVRMMADELPGDAEEPVIKEAEANFPLMSVSLSGDAPNDVLSHYARNFRKDLAFLSGIERTSSFGLAEPAFWVHLDRRKMMQYGLGIDRVSEAVRAKNLDIPGANFSRGNMEFLLKTGGKISSVEELLAVPVSGSPDGGHVLLRDVAEVVLGDQKEKTRSRINGRPAITFFVRKQKDADILETTDAVKRLVAEYETEMPEQIEIAVVSDRSVWVKSRLSTMIKSGMLGLFMVLLLLALFLDRRAAFIAALGIPVSFLGALILIGVTGSTLSILSMFGLIMVLGVIVDDSIIVVENVQRYVSGGMEPLRAAVVGTREVALPVVATIMTNIAAFLPLLVATGLMGQFLSVIPKVAIFALCFSMFEALVIMPAHCADWLRPRGSARPPRGNAMLMRARRLYLGGLFFALRNRYAVTACFVFIGLLSVFLFARMPSVIFHSHDTHEVLARVENPYHSSVGQTDASAARVEEAVRRSIPPHTLKNVLSVIGLDYTDSQNRNTGDYLATVLVEYEDYSLREENGMELSRMAQREVNETVAGPKRVDFITQVGPPTGKPVEVKIRGEDISVLMEIASLTTRFLDGRPGVSAAASDLVYGKPERRMEVVDGKASIFGLSKRSVAREIQVLGDGLTVAKTRVGEEEAEINLRYAPLESGGVSPVKFHQILTPAGRWVPIGAVTETKDVRTPLAIKRENFSRTVTVTAEVDGRTTTSREVNAELASHLRELLGNYPGYSFRFSGEEEEYGTAISDIKAAAVAAALLIYLILAAILRSMFQPFIIMGILPLGIAGVVVGTLVRGGPVTLSTMIGMVALLGIVVNDSLLLMHFINRNVKRMRSKAAAVAFSAKHRFRPIVLTTITTFSGLASLMFIYRGEASILAPMAVALGFGLVFSSFVILYMIPCLYMILDDIGRRGGARLSAVRSLRAS